MQYSVLLDKNENLKDFEAEEQSRFVRMVLDTLEIPIEWEDEPLTIESKIKLRKQLETYKIIVLNDFDGGLKIFANNEVIGDWKKVLYKYKQDLNQIDPNKKLYMEANVDFWTIFEDHK